ncbi:MAG: hypothetical protein Q4A01_10425 [Coriobacteriales bacterium]|nr:hypothetical protein [Coriobacteriales bacterium]
MEKSFHYYGTYCAAILAGYSHQQSLEIGYSAQLVDLCSKTFLQRIEGPLSAATTQLTAEMAQARTDIVGLANITRIWASFHFLPYDLYAPVNKGGRRYRNKYRMICGPNGSLVADTVALAQGKGTQAAGVALHVLADTWAHRYFAGTPSLVINNTNRYFVELLPPNVCGPDAGSRAAHAGLAERPVRFGHNPAAPDDPEQGIYTNTIYQAGEQSVMNLGHGRAGHLPDYSFIRYRYVPAWADYEEITKDNPAEFYQAFCQMVYALGCLRTGEPFATNTYDRDRVAPHEQAIRHILQKRQLDAGACEDWCALGRRLSGHDIEPFDLEAHVRQYQDVPAGDKDETFLGRFILAALAQKGMVVNRIYSSGNPLAGRSIDYNERGFAGIRDFLPLVGYFGKAENHE